MAAEPSPPHISLSSIASRNPGHTSGSSALVSPRLIRCETAVYATLEPSRNSTMSSPGSSRSEHHLRQHASVLSARVIRKCACVQRASAHISVRWLRLMSWSTSLGSAIHLLIVWLHARRGCFACHEAWAAMFVARATHRPWAELKSAGRDACATCCSTLAATLSGMVMKWPGAV